MKRLLLAAFLASAVASAAHAGDYGVWAGQSGWRKVRGLTTSQARRIGAYPWHQVQACGDAVTVDDAGRPVAMDSAERAARAAGPYRMFEANHWRMMTSAESNAVVAAAAEASEAALRPVWVENGFEVPFVVYQSISNAYGWLVAYTDEGDEAKVRVHASPWPPMEEAHRLIRSAVVRVKANRRRFKELKGQGQVQARLDRLEALVIGEDVP